MSLAILALASGWGMFVAMPVFVSGARHERLARAGRLRRAAHGRGPRAPRERGSGSSWIARRAASLPGAATCSRAARVAHARRAVRGQEAALVAELPVVIDLLGVAVGAGCSPYIALEVAAQWAPPLAAARLGKVQEACRLGAGLAEALAAAGRSSAPLRPLTDTLATTVRLGAPIGPVLMRLAADARSDLRRAAEARARSVPVRLLFPLVLCVLPAFGLLTIVPTIVVGLRPG